MGGPKLGGRDAAFSPKYRPGGHGAGRMWSGAKPPVAADGAAPRPTPGARSAVHGVTMQAAWEAAAAPDGTLVPLLPSASGIRHSLAGRSEGGPLTRPDADLAGPCEGRSLPTMRRRCTRRSGRPRDLRPRARLAER